MDGVGEPLLLSYQKVMMANDGSGPKRNTDDVLPKMDHYRKDGHKPSRPTLEDLHEPSLTSKLSMVCEVDAREEEPIRDKFGWIEGVLIRNMLSIWGVMLFLRISWVVSQSGIWQTLIIIALSTFITLVTSLSISAIATNGEIGGGGTYYVISRVMGPGFGGSVGIIFAVANAVFCSLNVVGICQTIQDALKNYGGYVIVDGGDHDVRIIGTITMVVICSLCQLGAKYETKTQGFMLVVFTVGFTNFIAGSIIGPADSEVKKARGFLGYDLDLFRENWNPSYTELDGQLQDFFSVFSIYFPAMIGILAGANVSGDLKDPNSAIPKGTILGVLITSASYAVVAVICGATMKRAATGNVDDLYNGTHLDCIRHNCTYGIYHDYQAMTLISGYGPLNYAGCFAATFGSALASYVSCPKLLQMIGDDNIYPYWLVGVLGKGYGKAKEPFRAYAFTFFLALGFVLIAQLDVIALLISNFYLATFALINYSTFYVGLVRPIGWRPTFQYYNIWLSLLAAVLCVLCTFLISWPLALVNVAIILFFYLLVTYRKTEVNWGSSIEAQKYRQVLSGIYQLDHSKDHVKNYRPHILVMTGTPPSRPALVDFARLICENNSLLICGHIVHGRSTPAMRAEARRAAQEYFRAKKIKSLYVLVDERDMKTGAACMLASSGLGKMKPNVLLLGYKNNWRTCETESLDQYFNTIHTAFDLQAAVSILRMPEGSDHLVLPAKRKGGSIDVWWLYDDGGLTLLLSYVISNRPHWGSCRLRIFCIASGQEELEKERQEMAALLSKFRIAYSDLVVITDLSKEPKQSTRMWFARLIHQGKLADTEKQASSLQSRTDYHLRLKELLQEHSSNSSLVVMTLSVPRKGAVGAPTYMAWLEALTAEMPPFLLVRGNQTSVLTFYS